MGYTQEELGEERYKSALKLDNKEKDMEFKFQKDKNKAYYVKYYYKA